MVLYMYPTSLVFLIQKVDREFIASERMVARGLLMAFNLLTWTSIKMDLLALQYADEAAWKVIEGSLIQVAPDGTRTTLISAGEGIKSGTSIGVGSDGAIYVTNKGDVPGEGQVLKVSRKFPNPLLCWAY